MKDHKLTYTSQKQLHQHPTSSERQEEEMMKEAEGDIGVSSDPVENLKLRCLAKGVTGILDFGRVVRHFDFTDDHTLDYGDFCTIMNKSHMDLSTKESIDLFEALDTSKNGRVDVHNLIVAARPHMVQSRLKVIREAFNNLDREGRGTINVADIKHGFCVDYHPRFQIGEETREEIIDNFLGYFQTPEKDWDGSMNEEEFINYYAGVCPTIEDDVYFDLMMRQTFKLEHNTERLYHETASDKREEDLMNASITEVDSTTDPLSKLRAHCIGKGVSGILQLCRFFRSAVQDPTQRLSLQELHELLTEAGVELGLDECRGLLDAVKNDEGLVDVADLFKALRPPLSEERLHVIMSAFKKLDRTGDSVISAEDFKRGFCVDHHPRYLVGQETREEIIKKFLSKFESPDWDKKVTEEDFLNFYSVESTTIDNDTYFDLMMRQSFKL